MMAATPASSGARFPARAAAEAANIGQLHQPDRSGHDQSEHDIWKRYNAPLSRPRANAVPPGSGHFCGRRSEHGIRRVLHGIREHANGICGQYNLTSWIPSGGTSLSPPLWSAVFAGRDSHQGYCSGSANALYNITQEWRVLGAFVAASACRSWSLTHASVSSSSSSSCSGVKVGGAYSVSSQQMTWVSIRSIGKSAYSS